MNSDDILKKLWAIKARHADKIPEGFKDLDTLSKEWQVHRTTAREWVMALEAEGKIKKVKLRFFDGRRIQMKYFYG